MLESTKELGSPFISESIWTAGLADIFVRGGRTREGSRLWNPQDSAGDKIYNSIGHLIETQAPLNWKQLVRLGMAIEPINAITGKFDERGNEYQLGNELAGIAGLRRVEVDPVKSFNYKITDYKKGVRDSRNLFTSATLKGGPITPKEIVDAYINANRALYGVNREMYQDMEAAKILGMNEDSLAERMIGRGEKKAFNFINEGEFRPLSISKDVKNIFEIKAAELGVANPFEQAEDIIDRIRDVLFNINLRGDFFPDIENPLDTDFFPNVVAQANQIIGNNPTNAALAAAPAAGFVGQSNVNIDPVTKLTAAEEIYLDPTEKVYRKNQRTNTRLT